jgi:hypothetical protein
MTLFGSLKRTLCVQVDVPSPHCLLINQANPAFCDFIKQPVAEKQGPLIFPPLTCHPKQRADMPMLESRTDSS